MEREGPAGNGRGDGGAGREREQVHVHGFGLEVFREDVFEHPGALAVNAEIMHVEAAYGDGGGAGEEVDAVAGEQRDVGEREDGGLRGELERGIAEGLRIAADGDDGVWGLLRRVGDGDFGTELLARDIPEDRRGGGEAGGLRGGLHDGRDGIDHAAGIGIQDELARGGDQRFEGGFGGFLERGGIGILQRVCELDGRGGIGVRTGRLLERQAEHLHVARGNDLETAFHFGDGLLQNGKLALQIFGSRFKAFVFRTFLFEELRILGAFLFEELRIFGTFFFKMLFVFGAFLFEEHFDRGVLSLKLVDLLRHILFRADETERDHKKDDQKQGGNQVDQIVFHVRKPFMVAEEGAGTGRSRRAGSRP